MAFLWTLVHLLCCLFVIDAFPHSSDYGYVVYTFPVRHCVPPPSPDTVCHLKHDITGYMKLAYRRAVASINATYDVYKSIPFLGQRCGEAVTKLSCQFTFPACLSGRQLDYGNRQQLFDEVDNACPHGVLQYLQSNPPFKDMPSGVTKDPHALSCVAAPQDAQKLCPKPKYKLLSSQVKDYHDNVVKVVGELNEGNKIPSECYEEAKSLFACNSYAFCSADEKYLLLKTSRQDCFALEGCFKKHGQVSNEVRTVLNETCPKYPDKEKAQKVKLPPL